MTPPHSAVFVRVFSQFCEVEGLLLLKHVTERTLTSPGDSCGVSRSLRAFFGGAREWNVLDVCWASGACVLNSL